MAFLDPRHEDLCLYSSFVQDRISLVPDSLELTFGAKALHHEHTGFEFQPSARLLWKPDERHTIWGAVTRALKTPDRHNRDSTTSWGVFQMGPSTISQESYGNRHVDAEEVMAYELGYRTQPTERLLLDVTGFFNDYEEIFTVERQPNIAMPGYTIWPFRIGNNLHGETYGVELASTYLVSDYWRLHAGYTFLQMQLHPYNAYNTGDAPREGSSPHNQFQLRSVYDLTDDLELDFSLNYVDNVPEGDIPNYLRFDVHLGWNITENLELSLVGQNLFNKRHPEFGVTNAQIQTEAEQGFYTKLTYRF